MTKKWILYILKNGKDLSKEYKLYKADFGNVYIELEQGSFLKRNNKRVWKLTLSNSRNETKISEICRYRDIADRYIIWAVNNLHLDWTEKDLIALWVYYIKKGDKEWLKRKEII